MDSKRISSDQSLAYLSAWATDGSNSFECNGNDHSVTGTDGQGQNFVLKLPLQFPKILENEKIAAYLKRILFPVPTYTLVLIQAGYAALGYFENGMLSSHKTFRTYMVRKKQGKNQLTYSHKGGGRTSSGSQLRYQNGLHFFEEINQTLNDWQTNSKPTRIFYSCPVRMWSFLFDSKVKSAFDRKDQRLHKIPLYVNTPNYDELLRLNRFISSGVLTVNNLETRPGSPTVITDMGKGLEISVSID